MNDNGYHSDEGRRITCYEGVVEADEEVFVRGKGEWVDASRLALNVDDKQVLVLSKPDDDKFVISDDPDMN